LRSIRTGQRVEEEAETLEFDAATALAHDLSLYTLNPEDLRGLEDLIEIIDISARSST